MDDFKLIDRWSYIVAAVVFVLGMLLFYTETAELAGSISAAVLAAGLAWVSYVLVRLLVLSFRKR